MPKSTQKSHKRKVSIARPPPSLSRLPPGPANNGYWQKKINGKVKYFGRWGKVEKGKLVRLPGDGWQEVIALYKTQCDDLYAGRTPRVNKTGDGSAALLFRAVAKNSAAAAPAVLHIQLRRFKEAISFSFHRLLYLERRRAVKRKRKLQRGIGAGRDIPRIRGRYAISFAGLDDEPARL